MVDLGLAGRITVSPRQIEVTGSQSVEDRRLSNVLRSLSAAAPPPGLKDWLRRTPRSLTIEYLSRLEDQKAVRVRRWRAPGGCARHDILSVDLPRRRALLARLDNVVRSGSATPKAAHDISLAMLVQAAGLASAAYPGLQGIIDRRRLAALAASDHLTPATANAVLGDDAELAAALTTGAGCPHPPAPRRAERPLRRLHHRRPQPRPRPGPGQLVRRRHSFYTGHHSGGHGNGSHGDW